MGPDSGRNVRVVAKIRSSAGQEAPWIFVNKPKGDESESVSISFGEQSAVVSRYELDFCYEQNQRNDVIFSREVKPLISGVIEGRNATVIAHGPRCSGKTYLIQGTEDEPGVALLTMAELLSVVVENRKSISVSFYEIVQEHVYDLLDPKRGEVLILEAQGKVQLKGLSQVVVKSISEFQKLYDGGRAFRKSEQKMPIELPRRSHKGLIIYVSSSCETLDIRPAGKINFVDLAGYEDARRKSSDGPNFVENTKINRSIHALQNVVYSLKANESHVPYRESKLTRLLQDSMGGSNPTLMVTCLSPWFCQESIYMLSLASRCYQCTNWVVSKSTRITDSSTRSMTISHKARVLGSFSTTARKPTVPRVQFSEKKRHCVGSALKARKLFDEGHRLKFAKTRSLENVSLAKCLQEEEEDETRSLENISIAKCPQEEDEEKLGSHVEDVNSVCVEEALSLENCTTQKITTSIEGLLHIKDNHKEEMASTKVSCMDESGKDMDKENDNSIVHEVASPPISAQLQELSNNLKSLYFSTPSYIGTAERNDTSAHDQPSIGLLELRTPERQPMIVNDQPAIGLLELRTPERRLMNANDTREVARFSTPWNTFNMRSSGVKNSLVHEYLTFLNTANREELKKLKGVGEKRATYILELRKESPEPFKNLDDLKNIGLSAKQVKRMMRQEVAGLFG